MEKHRREHRSEPDLTELRRTLIEKAERFAAAPHDGYEAGYQPDPGPSLPANGEVGIPDGRPRSSRALVVQWLYGVIARDLDHSVIDYRVEEGTGGAFALGLRHR